VSKKAFITGITGQDGAYLAKLLLDKGYEVYGLMARRSTDTLWRLQYLGVDTHVQLLEGDLTDLSSLIRGMEKSKASEVYNLGGQSFVGTSWGQPILTANVTGVGALNVLEAVRLVNPEVRFYQASTSEMYGLIQEARQSESTPFYPRSPYAAAKLYSYWVVRNYRDAYGLHASNGILFNHESPRRGETFVTRKITLAASRIKLGLQEKLYLGNLDAVRDWGFAPEYVKSMWLMLQQEKPNDYVVATGVGATVRDFCEASFSALDMDYREFVETEDRYTRPTEVDALIGDPSKAESTLDWKAKTHWKELAEIMIESDMRLISGKSN